MCKSIEIQGNPRNKDKRLARNPNLDLIRCVAVLCVLSVHFFLNTGFYATPIGDFPMVAALILRGGFMVCVPLFALLTGYLCSKKQLSPGYFRRIGPMLTTYLLACLLALLGLVVVRRVDYNLMDALFVILKIENGAIQYAWYVEMYIGLFLLIPFLNLIYNNLASQKEKQLLIGILLFLTMAPVELNHIDDLIPEFLDRVSNAAHFEGLLPEWWEGIWPLSYYFIGAYLREYDLKLPKGKNLLLLLASVVLFGLVEARASWNTTLIWRGGSAYGGLQNTVNSVLLFVFLLHLDLSGLPDWLLRLINRVSLLSFGIYLCSFLSDEVVYGWLCQWKSSFLERLPYFPLAVLASFLVAAALSQLVEWVRRMLFWGAQQGKRRLTSWKP